jgi:hypothetical protein
MKNINQIFKNNKHLMDEPEVMELIEYCRELEGDVLDVKINKQYDKEEILHNIVKEIYSSCRQLIKDEEESVRFGETPRVDFEKSIVNLKRYIEDINVTYKFGL